MPQTSKSKSFLGWLKTTSLRYQKIIILLFVFWGLWAFGLGALGGWLLSKAGLDKFPDLTKDDRLLILAPHIDDEVISSAGVIQEANKIGATVKIVYMTNGDENLSSLIGREKIITLNPNDFITLGEQRMNEAQKAAQILGLQQEDLIFLGYPDLGLIHLLNKNFDEKNPYNSQGTKFDYNPYHGTYKEGQNYTGSNVVENLKEILKDFQPTIIIAPHLRDQHPDHRATFQFLEKVLTEEKIKPRVFAYFVHYPLFPSQKKLQPNQFLYPPKKLFSQKGWFSFDITPEQENKKLEAVNQNKSQLKFLHIYNLLQSFVKRNEIFEEMEGF
ncbi:MAG: PIG-L family deacetylase [Candidatus Shapirobacteria bacterium]|nr:PIG-L family deacetylase [Candidatus Shapirobacteria bacterium]